MQKVINSNESKFEQALLLHGIESERHPTLKYRTEYKVCTLTPDFYIPERKLYCEVITTPSTLAQRLVGLRYCIGIGLQFTFYTERLHKILFLSDTLLRLGVNNNKAFPVIPELPYKDIILMSTKESSAVYESIPGYKFVDPEFPEAEVNPKVKTVLDLIQQFKIIAEKQIMVTVWKDLSSTDLEAITSALIKAKLITRQYKGPSGEPGVWYSYIEQPENN